MALFAFPFPQNFKWVKKSTERNQSGVIKATVWPPSFVAEPAASRPGKGEEMKGEKKVKIPSSLSLSRARYLICKFHTAIINPFPFHPPHLSLSFSLYYYCALKVRRRGEQRERRPPPSCAFVCAPENASN